jgi:hypothetical protein
MGVILFRTLLLIIVIALILLSIPSTRKRILASLKKEGFTAFKKNLITALLLYFLLSVILTLRDCSYFA